MKKLLLAILVILQPIPAQAWSEGGHHIIAFVLEKHQVWLEEINLVVGPEDFGHILC